MKQKAEEELMVKELEVLEFLVNRKPYAIDVKMVREILQIDRVSSVPNASESISGLALVRGEVVTVVDLRFVLERKHAVREGLSTNLFCEVNGLKVAFWVDEVVGIHRIQSNQVTAPDALLHTELVVGNVNLDNTIIMILDIEKIIRGCIQAA